MYPSIRTLRRCKQSNWTKLRICKYRFNLHKAFLSGPRERRETRGNHMAGWGRGTPFHINCRQIPGHLQERSHRWWAFSGVESGREAPRSCGLACWVQGLEWAPLRPPELEFLASCRQKVAFLLSNSEHKGLYLQNKCLAPNISSPEMIMYYQFPFLEGAGHPLVFVVWVTQNEQPWIFLSLGRWGEYVAHTVSHLAAVKQVPALQYLPLWGFSSHESGGELRTPWNFSIRNKNACSVCLHFPRQCIYFLASLVAESDENPPLPPQTCGQVLPQLKEINKWTKETSEALVFDSPTKGEASSGEME